MPDDPLAHRPQGHSTCDWERGGQWDSSRFALPGLDFCQNLSSPEALDSCCRPILSPPYRLGLESVHEALFL